MNRRQFIATSSATAVVATAGCSDILGDDDDTDGGGANGGDDAGSGDSPDGDTGDSEGSPSGDDQGQEATQSPPNVRFGFDYADSAEELTIQHRAGDSFAADSVTVEGAAGDVDWGTDTVSAGNSVTVPVGNVDSVSIVWESETGTSQQLATFDISG